MQTTSQKFTQLRRGLLEFAILRIINSAEHLFFAKEIASRLENTELAIPKGTLYATLLKMRRESLIEHFYDESDVGPPRKYYFTTAKRKKLLTELESYWKMITDALELIKKRPF